MELLWESGRNYRLPYSCHITVIQISQISYCQDKQIWIKRFKTVYYFVLKIKGLSWECITSIVQPGQAAVGKICCVLWFYIYMCVYIYNFFFLPQPCMVLFGPREIYKIWSRKISSQVTGNMYTGWWWLFILCLVGIVFLENG